MIRVKKCETTGFEPGKSCPGFLYVTLHCWPCPIFCLGAHVLRWLADRNISALSSQQHYRGRSTLPAYCRKQLVFLEFFDASGVLSLKLHCGRFTSATSAPFSNMPQSRGATWRGARQSSWNDSSDELLASSLAYRFSRGSTTHFCWQQPTSRH